MQENVGSRYTILCEIYMRGGRAGALASKMEQSRFYHTVWYNLNIYGIACIKAWKQIRKSLWLSGIFIVINKVILFLLLYSIIYL